MTKKEFARQRNRLMKLINYWVKHLGLGDWRFRYLFEGNECPHNSPNWTYLGRTEIQWPYKSAQITFYLANLANSTDYDVETTVIHELTHVLVAEIADSRRPRQEHVERVTTNLTNAFRWVRDRGREEGKKCTH